ncbi:MAG TPA: hypothetical protein VIM55_12180 [Mucilaginibacter sp.]
MQKVVTVNSSTDNFVAANGFKEVEYPTINSYLNDGYIVSQVIAVEKPGDTGKTFSLTFVLENDNL